MQSVFLNLRHRPISKVRFPIRASWSSRMDVASDAEIILGGRLLLGLAPGTPGMEDEDYAPRTGNPSAITLRAGARFETKGSVVIAPGSQVIVAPGGSVTLGKDHYN